MHVKEGGAAQSLVASSLQPSGDAQGVSACISDADKPALRASPIGAALPSFPPSAARTPLSHTQVTHDEAATQSTHEEAATSQRITRRARVCAAAEPAVLAQLSMATSRHRARLHHPSHSSFSSTPQDSLRHARATDSQPIARLTG